MTALSWRHTLTDVPDAGLEVSRDADATELAALAPELQVLACGALRADYGIRRIGEGRYLMSGKIRAEITQSCVVTLEPVEQTVDESILVEFATEAEPEQGSEDAELAVLDGDKEIEPLTGGRIDAGRVVAEIVAAAVDPYPRKLGAVFDWQDTKASDPGATGPFAGLARLKNT